MRQELRNTSLAGPRDRDTTRNSDMKSGQKCEETKPFVTCPVLGVLHDHNKEIPL